MYIYYWHIEGNNRRAQEDNGKYNEEGVPTEGIQIVITFLKRSFYSLIDSDERLFYFP